MRKYYLEVNRPEGWCHEVDPDIPAWGTSRGSIVEFDSMEELLAEKKRLEDYWDSLD